ncbi:exported protein of unknown function [Tenacibaculum sp. 190524A02b]|uniref:Lipoprotein n=1 Tax=Tenacibaculum vairaonense TaxID=3137860 RepID=A0ABP1FFT7_9FLAO
MKKSKKLTVVMFALLTSLFFTSCSNQETELLAMDQQERKLPKLVDGRLTFESKEQFATYLKEKVLMNELLTSLQNENFQPLKSVIMDEENGYADFVLDLYNSKREIQIGSEVIFIKNWKQFVVKKKDEKLLQQFKENNTFNKGIVYEGVKVYEIKKQRTPLKKQEVLQRGWVDAKYQYNFHDNGTPVKFVFEAYVNTYYIGILRVDYGIRMKYEWLHGRRWKLSGDIVYKEVKDLAIDVWSRGQRLRTFRQGFASNTSSSMYIVSGTFNVLPATPFTINFSGNLFAEIRQGSKPRVNYRQYCQWNY